MEVKTENCRSFTRALTASSWYATTNGKIAARKTGKKRQLPQLLAFLPRFEFGFFVREQPGGPATEQKNDERRRRWPFEPFSTVEAPAGFKKKGGLKGRCRPVLRPQTRAPAPAAK